jgi:hypothetical protein
MEPPAATLQLILPTDKRNPCFTLYQTEDGQFIHVYYGVERLEVVPAAGNHPAYRMLVARLYNADVKVSALAELFDLDHKTIRAWGLALDSGDPDALQRMLFGPPRKLTAAIREFIAGRWPALLAQRCRNYREVLQTEIKTYFGVSVSGEALRVMMNQLTRDRADAAARAPAAPEVAPPTDTRTEPSLDSAEGSPESDLFAPAKAPETGGEPLVPDGFASKSDPWCRQPQALVQAPDPVPFGAVKPAVWPAPEASDPPQTSEVVEVVTDPDSGEWTCFPGVARGAGGEPPARPEIPDSTGFGEPPKPGGEPPVPDWFASKFDPSPWQPQSGEATLCDHAGVMLFAHALASLPAVVDPPQPILSQWLAATLLGAHNIEQTKLLNWSDLSLLLGTVVRFPAPQRELLGTLATPPTVAAVLRWNFHQLGEPVMRCDDFYLDPHTKHYTGMQRVLKGWCASIRWADKVMHGDFIHTAQGHPVYFEWVDNYEDLRVRFLPLIGRMRTTLGLDGNDPQAPPRTLTITVDRAIFSNDLFNLVAADPYLHLITWEKGFTPGLWDPSRVTTRFAAERQRNNSRDVRLYQFSVIDQPWARNPAIRQLIVLATNPQGKVAQVAILTDGRERPAKEIVWLIFNRWIQENDFKYIDKHMGMKQITSYKSIDYAELRGSLEDRQVPNELFVQKTKEGKRVTRRKARLLLADDTARRQEAARLQEIARLEADPEPTGPTAPPRPAPGPSKRLKALRQASRRSERYARERREQLDLLQLDLDRIEAEKAALDKEVSRREQLIEQRMVRMDTTNKTLMDAIKICARNLFYQALAPFKKLYDNNRDDHAQFRELTRCDGVLRLGPAGMEVHLLAPMHLAPKTRRIFGEVLDAINADAPPLPDGSSRKVRLCLTEKSRVKVQLSDDSEVQPSSI